LRKVAKFNMVEVFPLSAGPEERKSKESMGYSLTGITSWLVMKRTRHSGLARMDLGGNGFSLEARLGVPEGINSCS
jgi:hypothetical protein